MALTLSKIVTDKGRAAVQADRLARHADRAAKFLRAHCGPRVAALNDEQLRAVALGAYAPAARRGITSEKDHFKYLTAVSFWHTGFERDPVRKGEMIRAGWMDTDNTPIANVVVHNILTQVDEWYLAAQTDLTPPKRIINGFARLYRDETATPAGNVDGHRIVHWLAQLWPTLGQRMAPDAIRPFVERAYADAKALDFDGADGIAYTALCVYFGLGFDRDPLYPWATAALASDGRDRDRETRRFALGDAVSAYWKSIEGLA